MELFFCIFEIYKIPNNLLYFNTGNPELYSRKYIIQKKINKKCFEINRPKSNAHLNGIFVWNSCVFTCYLKMWLNSVWLGKGPVQRVRGGLQRVHHQRYNVEGGHIFFIDTIEKYTSFL